MKYDRISLKHGDDTNAYLEIYSLEETKEIAYTKRPLIMLFPGGGYYFVSEREKTPIALQFVAEGYNVAMVNYSTAPHTYPTQYFQAFEALKYMLDNSEKYSVDTSKIATMGFSAGGHLAAMVGTGFNDPLVLKEFGVEKDFFKISAMVLAYPVITGGEFAHRGSFDNLLGDRKDDRKMIHDMSVENRVTDETPKAFVWSTFMDQSVPCENSLLFISELRKRHIPFELHIFENGGHGLSLANDLTMTPSGNGVCRDCESWIPLCKTWLRSNFSIENYR